MKKMVWFGFLLVCLAGCGGTYKSVEIQHSPVPQEYSNLAFEITSPEGTDPKELESFKGLIISQLEKRGFVITPDAKRRLIVEIVKFNKDALGKTVRDLLGPPFGYKTTNLIDINLFVKDEVRTIEFPEFDEFKESIRNWEDLKQTVARRIADAVYGAVR